MILRPRQTSKLFGPWKGSNNADETDMASSSPNKLSVTLRPSPPSKFGHQVFDFEQMTTESYAKNN
jgi:hypothetical protein